MPWTSYLPSSPESLTRIEWGLYIFAALLAVFAALLGLAARYVGQHKAQIILKEQNAKNIDIKNLAEEAKNKVSEIEAKQKPRRLSEMQKTIIIKHLEKYKYTKIKITTVMSNVESINYAEDFVSIFKKIGWQVEFDHTYDLKVIGIEIFVHDINNISPGAIELVKLLKELGIQSKNIIDPDAPPDIITMFIGHHP